MKEVEIPEIKFVIDSGGSWERADKIAQAFLDRAGIRPVDDGGSIQIAPVEGSETKLRVTISRLEADLDDSILGGEEK